MSVASWCILAAAVLPYFFGLAAKSAGVDNQRPRPYMDKVGGWRQRAYWAHQNGFEAFPPFAAAVLLAQFAQAPQQRVDLLALGFIAFRLVYGLLYIADRGALRSLSWAAGFACVIAIFLAAA